MAQTYSNPLMTSKSTGTGNNIAIHPLVLLTVSDQITRHAVRGEDGPIVGIILGQQRKGEITMEHAFSAKLTTSGLGDQDRCAWSWDLEWLTTRIEQYKLVHKAPPLEVVGWFTLCPESGPIPEMGLTQVQMSSILGENSILLGIHPESVLKPTSSNAKLPISVYESVTEVDHGQDAGSMQVDGQDSNNVKFVEVPYTVETDETEMIAINYVAVGAGSAMAVDDTDPKQQTQSEPTSTESKGKGKADVAEESVKPAKDDTKTNLTPEEEDQIANITTRLNSVKMLQTRLALLSNFVKAQPQSYLTDQNIPLSTLDTKHLAHLRSLQALLTRLSLLTPEAAAATSIRSQQQDSLTTASQSQSNDVALSRLLSMLSQDVQCISELGRKLAMVENARESKRNKLKGFPGPGLVGGGGGVSSGPGGMSIMDGPQGGGFVNAEWM